MPDLTQMTTFQLRGLADYYGISLSRRMTKTEIISEILPYISEIESTEELDEEELPSASVRIQRIRNRSEKNV